MTSLVCMLDGSAHRTAVALREAEHFAQVQGLDNKQALHLRLLSEELLGLINGVLDVKEGQFWIEEDGGSYFLHLDAAAFSMGDAAKRRLLSTSSTGENIFYQGVTGKIRMVIDWFSSGAEELGPAPMVIDEGLDPVESFGDWSLERLRQNMDREEKAKRWDELEWSVLTSLADDVRVGLRTGKASVTVVKRFS